MSADKYQRLRNWEDEVGDDDIIPEIGRNDFEFTLFDSAKAITPQASGAISWLEFVEFCRESYGYERHRSHKLDSPAIIAGHCVGKRSNHNVRFLSMIAADFDIGPDDARYRTFDQMVHHLMEQDIACVIYTTTSNTQAHNRYRVIMPLQRNVSPTIWPAVWQAANAKFNGAFDAATKDPARLSFLPAQWTADTFIDARKGQITLDNAFNDFAFHTDGRPILSDAELDNCAASAAWAQHAPPQRRPQRPHDPARPNQATAVANTRTATATATAGTVSAAIRPMSPVVFAMLTSTRGPLVSKWMRDDLPQLQGSRTYRFLKNAVARSQAQGLTINADVLCALAANWLAETRNAPPPADLYRQAQNAINFAIQTQQ